MSKTQAPAVTNLRYYKNQTKKGNPTATPAKKGVHYYTFGQGESMTQLRKEDEELAMGYDVRGTWYDRNGAEVNAPQMTEWVEQNAPQNKYTYTAVLSVRDGDMNQRDFIKAMNEQDVFTDYRLITHGDTGHDHAHVMMFRDKTLSKAEFNSWRKTVGNELEKSERRQLDRAEREAAELDSYNVDVSGFTLDEDDLDNYLSQPSQPKERQVEIAPPPLKRSKKRSKQIELDDEFEMER